MNNIKKLSIVIIITLILSFPTIVYSNSDIIVLLDPGHGGNLDSGAVSDKLRETDITWKIATKVKEILDKHHILFKEINEEKVKDSLLFLMENRY